ncbi:MAG: hypothetical protein WBP79_05310, partial [Candidatus Acidiferrales bacterium]
MRRTCFAVFIAAIFSFFFLLNAGSTAVPRVQAASAQSDHLGKIDFPTSCSPQAQATIVKGVALLHSFQYMQSEQTFADSAKQDPQCAMAQWGKATALYEQLWYFPAPGTIAEARGYLEQGQKLGAPTAREREYIAA